MLTGVAAPCPPPSPPPPSRTDTFANTGAILAAFATALYFKQYALQYTALNLIGGSAVGSSLGVLLHLATKPADHKSPNKMVSIIKE